MRAVLPSRARFILLAVGLAVLLFGVFAWLTTRLPGMPLAAAYTVPALAVMLAAQGLSWRRKAVFVCGTTLVVVGGLLMARAAGAERLISQAAQGHLTLVGLGGSVATIAYHVFSVGVPVAAVVLFVGRRPSVLWEAPAHTSRAKSRR